MRKDIADELLNKEAGELKIIIYYLAFCEGMISAFEKQRDSSFHYANSALTEETKNFYNEEFKTLTLKQNVVVDLSKQLVEICKKNGYDLSELYNYGEN